MNAVRVNGEVSNWLSVNSSQRPYTKRDTIELTVEGEPVENVSNFVYLGANISGNGTEILTSGSSVPMARSISSGRYETVELYKHLPRSASTRLLTSLRSILKTKWFYYVSNDEALRRAGVKSINTLIGSARLRCHRNGGMDTF